MSGSDARQYLTFGLGAEDYGVDILKVQEIRGLSPITPIPNMPHFLKGIMNLRGAIVPVVGLRSKLAMPEVDPSPATVIIMVRVGAKATGLIVDAVSDVLTIPDTAIEPPPDVGAVAETAFLKGTARVGEKLIVLLDIDRVLSADETGPREALI